ncbi:MAG: amidohydrolase family protein [Anaerolineae bacterium]
MLIDAHVHYTPPSLAADLDAFIREEPFWGQMLALRPDGSTLQGWATAERMIADMDAAGVDKVVLMGEYRRSHEGCVARNDQALAIIRRWPDRVIAFAMLQPKAGQAALDELARCLDGGMRGVGELGPYGQGYRLDDPDFLRVVEACIRADIPVNLHTNEEVGGFYPGKATTPLRDYYRLASRYPELRLILAHWGGGLFFYELMPEVRRTLRNVWYDTAASPLQYRTRQIFDVALRCVDHRKLLYASDYPLRLYLRRQAEPDFRPFLAEIEALGLPDDVRADILGGNVARVFEPTPPAPLPVREGGDKISPLLAGEGLWVRSLAGEGLGVRSLAGEGAGGEVTPAMSTLLVAEVWPETRAVFARYGIPCEDSPVPFWEPISQAAAARGLGPDALARLVAELNEAIGSRPKVERSSRLGSRDH